VVITFRFPGGVGPTPSSGVECHYHVGLDDLPLFTKAGITIGGEEDAPRITFFDDSKDEIVVW
jgi:hypothetical protein